MSDKRAKSNSLKSNMAARGVKKKAGKGAAMANKDRSGNGLAIKPISKANPAFSKHEIVKILAEQLGITRSQANGALIVLGNIIEAHLVPGSAKSIKVLNMKIAISERAARPQRVGRHPVTGKETIFKAKPKHEVIRIRPLKKLKEIVHKGN